MSTCWDPRGRVGMTAQHGLGQGETPHTWDRVKPRGAWGDPHPITVCRHCFSSCLQTLINSSLLCYSPDEVDSRLGMCF